MEKLLEVEDLNVSFGTSTDAVRAVRGLNLSVAAGEIVALVGESGCGKSLSALAVMKLIPPTARATGSIRYNGIELLSSADSVVRSIRGKEIGMVFQEPMTSLNPAFTVGDQIAETLRFHLKISRSDAARRAIDLLGKVRIAAPEQRAKAYPHQLSGGMRQRVMIAIALSCNPKFLILDEPTTALDVTTQAQVLEIVRELRSESDTGVLLITHDLGVVADLADRVVVMYAGSPVERAEVGDLFANPSHPYTNGLLNAVPRRSDGIRRKLADIPGTVPVVRSQPDRCVFSDRCTFAESDCLEGEPAMSELSSRHQVACLHPLYKDAGVLN